MRHVGVILYRPHKGKEEELLRHLRAAFPMLRRNGFITDSKVIGLRARDGRILVIFEWASAEAIDLVGEHPEVQEYWMEQDKISTFEKAADLPEFQRTIPVFEGVDIE
jgi:quinol monooxygenase YgiN